MHVLLADDDRDSVVTLAELLTLLADPIQITLAFDGVEVLTASKVSSPPYDAVITDIEMPRMDGITAANGIRSALGIASPLLIAMTGHMDVAKLAAMSNVFDHILLKPLKIEQLVEILRDLALD